MTYLKCTRMKTAEYNDAMIYTGLKSFFPSTLHRTSYLLGWVVLSPDGQVYDCNEQKHTRRFS